MSNQPEEGGSSVHNEFVPSEELQRMMDGILAPYRRRRLLGVQAEDKAPHSITLQPVPESHDEIFAEMNRRQWDPDDWDDEWFNERLKEPSALEEAEKSV